jgi:hypothetical protein
MLKKYHREKSTAVLGPAAKVENPVFKLKPFPSPVDAAAAFAEDDDDVDDAFVFRETIPRDFFFF